MANEQSSNDLKKVSPNQWSGPKDARDMNGAGKYPNYWTHKTRSGHIFMLDDSQDAEHVTLQHRGGSMIQFMPDGAIQFVAHNGQYNMIFGENRVKITGAYDVTVEGGGSLKVDGDYNVTVKGDTKFAVGGNFNLTAQNFNQLIGEDISVVAKNRTEKVSGAISQTSDGSQYIASGKAMSINSTQDGVSIGAAKDMGLWSTQNTILSAGGDIDIRTDEGSVRTKAMKEASLQTTSGFIAMKAQGGDVSIQSDQNMSLKATNASLYAENGKAVVIGTQAYLTAGENVDIKGTPVNLNGQAGEPNDTTDPTLPKKSHDDFNSSGSYDAASVELEGFKAAYGGQ